MTLGTLRTMAVSVMMLLASADEKLARVRNIYRHITMHGMLAQQVNAKLLSGFRETELPIEGKDIGKYTPALTVMGKLEEFLRELDTRRRERSADGSPVEIVDPAMLVM